MTEDFIAVAHRIVWCTVATVDADDRPRSRVMHPVWEQTSDGPVARVATRATAAKREHIAHSPFASLSYWDATHDVAVAECAAEWDPDPDWTYFSRLPPPVGFDANTVFPGGVTHPHAAVLVLRPWRLRWARAADLTAGRPAAVWQPAAPTRT